MRRNQPTQTFLLIVAILASTASATFAQENTANFIEQLNYMEASARAYAAYALGEIGNASAVESLVPLLNDEDKYVRLIVVGALGKIGDAASVEALATALQDKERSVRLTAANALKKIDPNEQYEIDLCVKDLSHPDAKIRQQSAKKLSELVPEKAQEYQMTRYTNDAQDPDAQVRASAVEALGATANAETVQLLITALNDNDALVRKNAVTALGQIVLRSKDANAVNAAVEPLISLLQDKSKIVSASASTTLTEIGEPAVESLLSAVGGDNAMVRELSVDILAKIHPENRQEYQLSRYIKDLKDQDVSIRANAALALGSIYDARVVEPLIAALKDVDNSVRQNATNALIIIGEPAIDGLIPLLKSQEVSVQMHAAIALREIGLRLRDSSKLNPATDAIVGAFKNTDSPIHSIATQILKQLGSYAVNSLTPLLSDGNDATRAMAATMLAEIQPQKATDFQTMQYLNDLSSSSASVKSTAAMNLGMLGEAKAVNKLVALFGDSDDSVKKSVANALEQIGSPAIEPLISALASENKIIKRYAFTTLAGIAPKAKVDELQPAIVPAIEGLSELDSSIRSASTTILIQIGEPAVRDLIALFKGSNTSHSAAIKLLVQIGSPAIDALKLALNDQNSVVRKNAVAALTQIDPGNAEQYQITQYINDLKDTDTKIRMVAAFKLGRTNDNRAVEHLISALSDGNFQVRANAADSLAYLADKRAVKPLERVEDDDENKMVRRVAKESLERLKELP